MIYEWPEVKVLLESADGVSMGVEAYLACAVATIRLWIRSSDDSDCIQQDHD